MDCLTLIFQGGCNATRAILLPVSQWRVTPKDVMSLLGAVPTKNQRGLRNSGNDETIAYHPSM